MNNNIYFKYLLNHPNISDDFKKEMLMMSNEDIKKSFCEKEFSFGTAGYRSKTGPGLLYLNELTYQQLTIAYVRLLLDKHNSKKQLKVFVAHDNRVNGLKYANIVAATLSNMGFKVILHKNNLPIPTPMVSYVIRKLKLDGGINITASHNPKEYNGFKVFDDSGSQLNSKDIQKLNYYTPHWIENLRLQIKINPKNIIYLNESVINDYFQDIKAHININKIPKDNEPIIFVSHHGTTSLNKIISFLKDEGHNIIPVYSQSYLNENFENSNCINPEDSNSFKTAIKIADDLNSNIILGMDPDGDRLAVAIRHNKEWIFINGNENGILASYYLLKYKDYGAHVPTIVSTYVSNNLINKIVNKYDGLVLRTAVGFKNIANLMNSISIDERISFVIGFEEAVGLCISTSIREKDGIAAGLLMLEIYKFYKNKKMTLVDVLEKLIYEEFGNWIGKTESILINGDDWKIKVNNILKNIFNSKLTQIGKFKIKKIQWNEKCNCIEILFNDHQSWIKFRASGTEPKFKIYYNLYFNEPYFMYSRSYALKLNELEKINKFLLKEFNIL